MTRTAFLAALASMAAFAAAPPAHAARNAEAERYVEEHANEAFAALGDSSLSGAQKQQTFNHLVAQFSDMPRIAIWVLGRHAAQLRNDPTLRAEWTNAFQTFAITSYEYQLNQFSGSVLHVVGSTELTPNQTVDVTSEITPRGQTRPVTVRWRVNRSGQGWKAFDIQLVTANGDAIWLGQLQQQEFLAQLGRNGGDIRALLRSIQTQTASMRERMTRG
jgi:ABC-type transporter MlaC component